MEILRSIVVILFAGVLLYSVAGIFGIISDYFSKCTAEALKKDKEYLEKNFGLNYDDLEWLNGCDFGVDEKKGKLVFKDLGVFCVMDLDDIVSVEKDAVYEIKSNDTIYRNMKLKITTSVREKPILWFKFYSKDNWDVAYARMTVFLRNR